MRGIWVLMATAFVDMMGFAMVFPLLPFYATDLGASPAAIGWLIASFSIAQLATAPLWGRLSDRYGRKPMLLVGLGAAGIAFVVFGFATSVWMLLLSRTVQGGGGGTTGVVQAYIGDALGPRDRAKGLGWLSAATSAGVMIGPAIGSLASHFGRPAPGLVAATLCAINVVFAWRFLPESKPKHHTGARRSIRQAAWHVFSRPFEPLPRPVWVMGFVLALVPIGQALLFPAVTALATHRADPRELGQAMGVQQSFGGMARVIGPIWATWVFQYVGPAWPFFIASVIMLVVLLLTLKVPGAEPALAEPAAVR